MQEFFAIMRPGASQAVAVLPDMETAIRVAGFLNQSKPSGCRFHVYPWALPADTFDCEE